MPLSFIEVATLRTSDEVHQSTPQVFWVHQVFLDRHEKENAGRRRGTVVRGGWR